MRRSLVTGPVLAGLLCAAAFGAEKLYWLEPMKQINTEFEGNPGYVAQLGDSITYSMAFWAP